MEWDEYLQEAGIVLSSREKYQRVLGRVSSEIAKKYGPVALKDFAVAVKDTFGLSLSYMTLRNYRWVYDKTKELELPADIAYRTLQCITSSGRPEYWAKRINEDGLSSPEVYRMLREEKGLPVRKPQKTICPECTHEFECQHSVKH